jgi:hypothetical protein
VSEFSVRDKTGVIVARDAELDGNALGDSVGDFLCTEFVSFPSEFVLEDESSLDVETVGVFVEEVSFDIDLYDTDSENVGDGVDVGDFEFPLLDNVTLFDGVVVFVPADISAVGLGERDAESSPDALGDELIVGEGDDDAVGEGVGLCVS